MKPTIDWSFLVPWINILAVAGLGLPTTQGDYYYEPIPDPMELLRSSTMPIVPCFEVNISRFTEAPPTLSHTMSCSVRCALQIIGRAMRISPTHVSQMLLHSEGQPFDDDGFENCVPVDLRTEVPGPPKARSMTLRDEDVVVAFRLGVKDYNSVAPETLLKTLHALRRIFVSRMPPLLENDFNEAVTELNRLNELTGRCDTSSFDAPIPTALYVDVRDHSCCKTRMKYVGRMFRAITLTPSRGLQLTDVILDVHENDCTPVLQILERLRRMQRFRIHCVMASSFPKTSGSVVSALREVRVTRRSIVNGCVAYTTTTCPPVETVCFRRDIVSPRDIETWWTAPGPRSLSLMQCGACEFESLCDQLLTTIASTQQPVNLQYLDLDGSEDNLCVCLGAEAHFGRLWSMEAKLVGHAYDECRVKPHSPQTQLVLKEINHAMRANEPTTLRRADTSEVYKCIRGLESDHVLLLAPFGAIVRVAAADVEVVSRKHAVEHREPPSTGSLCRLHTLRVCGSTTAILYGLWQLRALTKYLVKLEIVVDYGECTDDVGLHAVLLCIPKSVEGLRIVGGRPLLYPLRAIVQAYRFNGLRVRSLWIDGVDPAGLMAFLRDLADPSTAAAQSLEELYFSTEQAPQADLVESYASMLRTNHRLKYVHAKLYQVPKDVVRERLSCFNGQPMLTPIFALLSVFYELKMPMDRGVVTRITRFAYSRVTRIVSTAGV